MPTFTTYGPNADEEGLAMAGVRPWGNSSAFGSVPSGPPIGSTAPAAVSGGIAAGNQVYNQLPGYGASLNNVGTNIQSETAGELPADVIRQIAQAGAERGVSTGSPGSPNSNAAYLRALGLNSLQLTQTGQGNLESILPHLPGASIASNPVFYVTPQQQYEADLQRNVFQAMPEPGAAQRAGLGAVRAGFTGGGGGGGGLPGQPPATMDMSPATWTGGAVGASAGSTMAGGIAQAYKSLVYGDGSGTAPSGSGQPSYYAGEIDPETGLPVSPSTPLGTTDTNSGENSFYPQGMDFGND